METNAARSWLLQPDVLPGGKRMTEGWSSLDINIKNYKDQLVLYSLDNKYHIKYKKRERKNGN